MLLKLHAACLAIPTGEDHRVPSKPFSSHVLWFAESSRSCTSDFSSKKIRDWQHDSHHPGWLQLYARLLRYTSRLVLHALSSSDSCWGHHGRGTQQLPQHLHRATVAVAQPCCPLVKTRIVKASWPDLGAVWGLAGRERTAIWGLCLLPDRPSTNLRG